ncbi:hypothetical protein CLAIMM_14670 [Cladophialophora immunda]|nr:hypothetical protein CLAIMM_14670 [Cladophialophora immunda]
MRPPSSAYAKFPFHEWKRVGGHSNTVDIRIVDESHPPIAQKTAVQDGQQKGTETARGGGSHRARPLQNDKPAPSIVEDSARLDHDWTNDVEEESHLGKLGQKEGRWREHASRTPCMWAYHRWFGLWDD